MQMETRLIRRPTEIKYIILNKWQQFWEKIRKIDCFGQPIHFTYEQEEFYKTNYGGILTIAIVAAIIIIGGVYLKNIVNKSEQTFNSNVQYLDLLNDQEEHIFQGQSQKNDDLRFWFGFGFYDKTGKNIDINTVGKYLNVTLIKN